MAGYADTVFCPAGGLTRLDKFMTTLQDLISASTPGPLVTNAQDPAWVDAPTGRHMVSAMDPELPFVTMKANALRLAHSYNMLPEVVTRMEMLICRMESEHKRFPKREQEKRKRHMSAARKIIAKANTITP